MFHKILLFSIFLITVIFTKELYSQDIAQIKKDVTYLASDSTQGRYPGTLGDSLAAYYIANSFANNKLDTLDFGYFQNFELQTGIEITTRNSFFIGSKAALLFDDFSPMSISAEGEFKSEVFEMTKDSMIDGTIPAKAKGKWLLIDIQDTEITTRELMRGASNASRSQVQGIIFKVESSDRFESSGVRYFQHNPREYNSKSRIVHSRSLIRTDIPVLLVTNDFFDHSTTNSDSLLITAKVEIKSVKKNTHNVIGVVKGSDSPGKYIVIGAHYDHLGYGGKDSGSRMPDSIAIHYGADDNASGTSTVLSLASIIAENPLSVSVMFVAFGAEEMGLIGSQYMVANLPVPKDSIIAMLNYDMVGRMEERVINVGGVKTAIDFETIIDTIQTNLDVRTSPFGSGPSDHSSFNSEEIPVLYFNTGIHTDYHTPNDNIAKINYDGIGQVVTYTMKLVNALMSNKTDLTYQQTESPAQKGSMASLKVTLGIIPDVTGGDNSGLLIQGVSPNGIAKRVNMIKGDKIVNIDGTTISNIYEYMEKLQTIKPRQVAHITIVRDGKERVKLVQF